MRRLNSLPELLAPAGDMECLYAAVEAGADAIYVGGRAFGARAYAKNFDKEELFSAVEYCHLHGVKLYVTVNTLVYNREMRELSDFVADIWESGADAVITADLGVIDEIKRRVPDLAVHASTQMSVHNTDGAEAAFRLGCERVVLARELSFENIKAVTEKSSAETEVFLHGALCVSHSGQCLFSSLVGGRSGNRGECAQPCRLPYCNKYPLSLSDLSLADHIPELIESGTASLKIEGRMKSPEYVYTVTSIYRKLLDERRCASRAEKDALRRIFSRGDFTDGYFVGNKFSKMTGVRSDKDKESTKEIAAMTFTPKRVPIRAEATLRLGEPATLTLTMGERSVTVKGAAPVSAINAPLTSEGVKARLSKMGATLLSLDASDISLSLDDGINLSPAEINALRRSAAEALQSAKRERCEREFSQENTTRGAVNRLKTALFLKKEPFALACEKNPEALSLFDIVFLPIENFGGESGGVYIPPVIMDSEIPTVERMLSAAKESGATYALVGNIGHFALAKRAGLVPIGDFRLNITNSYAREAYRALGASDAVLSPEITLPMARDIGGGEIVYGRVPLMLTERCFIKENFGCERCSSASLEDRTGAKFPMLYEFGHRNLILNSRPTYMGDRASELSSSGIGHMHFIFSVESADEVLRVISAFKSGKSLPCEVRRIGNRKI